MTVAVTDIADLSEPGVLAKHGIGELHPTRRQWPLTQPVGEACYREGCRGLLAQSAAHLGGQALAIFRPHPALRGLTLLPPPNHYDELPPLPTGLRT